MRKHQTNSILGTFYKIPLTNSEDHEKQGKMETSSEIREDKGDIDTKYYV